MVSDELTDIADSNNDGFQGLYPMKRPNWDITDDGEDNPVPVEASPWEFWDEAFWSAGPLAQATLTDPGDPCEGVPVEFCNWDLIQKRSNPDMSFEKATAYQDTILGYFGPRAYLALDLANLSDTEELLDQSLVEVFPNPTSNNLYVRSSEDQIRSIQVVDMQGRLVKAANNVNDYNYTMTNEGIGMGMYIVNIRFDEGLVTQKVIFK